MTRQEACKLSAILQHLRTGRLAYSSALMAMLDLVAIAESEHTLEDEVNTSLEQIAKGTGDDRPV